MSRFSASSLFTLVEMVDADLGITFLPEMAEGSALLRNTRVRTYPVPGGGHREIGLAWRCGSARVRAFERLGELLRHNSRERRGPHRRRVSAQAGESALRLVCRRAGLEGECGAKKAVLSPHTRAFLALFSYWTMSYGGPTPEAINTVARDWRPHAGAAGCREMPESSAASPS